MIDWKRFDWEEIFGSVASTSGLKRKQTRALRTEVQEIATSKYSDGQLKYVGDKEDGKDYIDCDGSSVEDKAQEGMFCKTTGRTKVFILKNFQGNQTKFVKTFDFNNKARKIVIIALGCLVFCDFCNLNIPAE